MCMSRPGVVVALRDGMAAVQREGRQAWCNALMVPEVKVGDWVLTHTSLVVSVISEREATETEALLHALTERPAAAGES